MSYSQTRVDRLRKTLSDIQVAAMYVRDTSNIEWLTGFEHVFDDEAAHALFVIAQESALNDTILMHTDSRYILACEEGSLNTPIRVDAERLSFSKWALKSWEALLESGALSHAQNSTRLAIEDHITLGEYRALEKEFESVKDFSFAETDSLILNLRAVKDESEIAAIREAQNVTDDAFSHIVEFIKPGKTEREIQLELDNYMLSHGADALAFQTIIASGTNGASPHAIVSDKPVAEGECIVMDFGAKKNGYCSDMTRTIFIGKPTDEMAKAYKALRKANEDVEKMLKPGVTGESAHNLALDILSQGGFGDLMGHGLGHGVGLQIHEEPVLSPRNKDALQAGNVVTVEPGIYIPNKFGMRLEDFGVVRPDGFEVFTKSTHEMIII